MGRNDRRATASTSPRRRGDDVPQAAQRTTTRVPARRGRRDGTRTDERGTGRRQTGYEPEQYGFRFANTFVNGLFSVTVGVPPFTYTKDFETDGRCGGMAFTSLDLYHGGRPIPTLPRDFRSSALPSDGDRLADYIYSRQLDSMARGLRGLRDALRFIRWSNRSTATLVRATDDEQIPKIIASLDAGDPVVLALIGATGWKTLGKENHQVVCYGHRTGPTGEVELLIYDPNEPVTPPPATRDHRRGTSGQGARRAGSADEVILSKREPDSSHPYWSDRPTHHERSEDVWRGFFVQRYRPRSLGPRIIGEETGTGQPGDPGTDLPPTHRH
jgi:hypothetical protein